MSLLERHRAGLFLRDTSKKHSQKDTLLRWAINFRKISDRFSLSISLHNYLLIIRLVKDQNFNKTRIDTKVSIRFESHFSSNFSFSTIFFFIFLRLFPKNPEKSRDQVETNLKRKIETVTCLRATGAPVVCATVLRWAPSRVTRRGALTATAAAAAAAMFPFFFLSLSLLLAVHVSTAPARSLLL